MKIEIKYPIETIVYLKTDTEQLPRMVVGYTIRKNEIIYILAQGVSESHHYDIEIDGSEDILFKISSN